jgi:ComF family protein
MWGSVRETLKSVVDLLLPRQCAACQTRDDQAAPLCPACAAELLAMVGATHCPRCGTTVGEGLTVEADGCPRCPTPMPRFGHVVRLGTHAPPLAPVIRRFKFRGDHAPCQWLAGLLAEKVRSSPELASVEVIQPVPLHWLRRLRRGYNQAGALAHALGKRLNLEVVDELVRIRNTPPQVHLPRAKRLENVRGAFAVHKAVRVPGRHVLLVDDVTTTGATAGEAARILLAAGASRVSLAVLAKADPPATFASRRA